jgi:hypothetical protein
MADDQFSPVETHRTRNWLMLFPLAIAVLSLVSSIFQSVNYSRQIESAQRNVLRSENLRTCKDIIEVFFQFRLKVEEANQNGVIARAALGASTGAASGQQIRVVVPMDTRALVYKFGALGTFLANFREKEARVAYTDLTWKLNELAEKAATVSSEQFNILFSEIDRRFDSFNQDCVKAATGSLL